MQLQVIRSIYREELQGLFPLSEIDAIFHRLVDHFTGLPRFTLALEPGKSLTKESEQPLFDALAQLKLNVPVQYITGKAAFMDLDLKVGPGVLIPRPETEELVRWIIDSGPGQWHSGRILDVGTGSGCIAIALDRAYPHATIMALDRSEDALQYARANARELDAGIEFTHADFREPGDGWAGLDLIVSNPPYVPRRDAPEILPHVRDHEPELALFVEDGDPLAPYRDIGDFAFRKLHSGGWLYFEIYELFGAAVAGLLNGTGFEEVLLKKDIFGKDRFVRGRKPFGL